MVTACLSFIADPYNHGWRNFKQGIKGEKPVAGDLNGRVEKLTCTQQIQSIAVGLLLLLPIINSIAFLILQKLQSQFIQTAAPAAVPNPPRPNPAPVFVPANGGGAVQNPPRPNPVVHPVAGRNTAPTQAQIRLLPDNDPLVATLVVNPAMLNKTPELFDLSPIQHMVSHAQPPIAATELLEKHFSTVFQDVLPDETLYQDQHNRITSREAKEAIQKKYIDFDDREYYDNKRYVEMVAGEFDLILKGISLELRKGEIPVEKKKKVLIDLASAAEHCVPRRHNAMIKAYRYLVNRMETVEQVVLEYNQMAKEQMFDDYYSLATESAQTINYIRKTVDDLGLDRREVNLNDPYIHLNDARSEDNPVIAHTTKEQFKATFNKIYTPARLIYHMRKLLNDRIAANPDFCTNISNFIANEIGEHFANGHISEKETDLLPKPYQNNYDESFPYHLTDAGVKFLVVHFKILNDQTPNGHLVRAQNQLAPQVQ